MKAYSARDQGKQLRRTIPFTSSRRLTPRLGRRTYFAEAFVAAALLAAHIFLAASAIRLRPAALMRLFAGVLAVLLAAFAIGPAFAALMAAHRRLTPSAILLRPAGLSRRFRGRAWLADDLDSLPAWSPVIARNAEMARSTESRCSSS